MSAATDGLNFSYDEISDVMTIEGIRYSGGLFRRFSLENLIPNGSRIFIESRDNGVLHLRHDNFPLTTAAEVNRFRDIVKARSLES